MFDNTQVRFDNIKSSLGMFVLNNKQRMSLSNSIYNFSYSTVSWIFNIEIIETNPYNAVSKISVHE